MVSLETEFVIVVRSVKLRSEVQVLAHSRCELMSLNPTFDGESLHLLRIVLSSWLTTRLSKYLTQIIPSSFERFWALDLNSET